MREGFARVDQRFDILENDVQTIANGQRKLAHDVQIIANAVATMSDKQQKIATYCAT